MKKTRLIADASSAALGAVRAVLLRLMAIQHQELFHLRVKAFRMWNGDILKPKKRVWHWSGG